MKRRFNKNIKKQPPPPRTRRYCILCDNNTTFIYNPNTLHSECSICGSRNITKK